MYFYLAMVGFEPTPTATAAPSNTETTVIPSRPLRTREGMTVVSVLLGAAVEVGVDSNPTIAKLSTSLFLHYIIFPMYSY